MQDIFADFKDVYLRNVSLDNAEKIYMWESDEYIIKWL
jgi:hypothetical protein